MADTPERDTAEAGKARAQGIGDELKNQGAAAAENAKKTAYDYADQAKQEAYARGEAYRDYAADETGKVAAALRRASEELSEGSPQERFVGQIADGVAEAADRVRGMTLDDMAHETTTFARRHPAAFLGGAALLGFAAARFLKASSHGGPDAYDMAEPPAPRPAGYTGAEAPMPSRASAPAGDRIPEPATRPAGTMAATSPAGTPTSSSPAGTPTSSSPASGSTGGTTSPQVGGPKPSPAPGNAGAPASSSGNSTASSDRPAGVPESKPL